MISKCLSCISNLNRNFCCLFPFFRKIIFERFAEMNWWRRLIEEHKELPETYLKVIFFLPLKVYFELVFIIRFKNFVRIAAKSQQCFYCFWIINIQTGDAQGGVAGGCSQGNWDAALQEQEKVQLELINSTQSLKSKLKIIIHFQFYKLLSILRQI